MTLAHVLIIISVSIRVIKVRLPVRLFSNKNNARAAAGYRAIYQDYTDGSGDDKFKGAREPLKKTAA